MSENTMYRVKGMTCGGCARGLTSAFQRAEIQATVDHGAGTATVAGVVPSAAVRAAVEEAGFEFVGALPTDRAPGGEM